jgi:hypothetical protein
MTKCEKREIILVPPFIAQGNKFYIRRYFIFPEIVYDSKLCDEYYPRAAIRGKDRDAIDKQFKEILEEQFKVYEQMIRAICGTPLSFGYDLPNGITMSWS